MHLNLVVLLVQLVWLLLLLEVLLRVLVKLLRGGTVATLLVVCSRSSYLGRCCGRDIRPLETLILVVEGLLIDATTLAR